YIIFFFSSRRRHTRFSRDWSSDVCSSDLIHPWLIRFRVKLSVTAKDPTCVGPSSLVHSCLPVRDLRSSSPKCSQIRLALNRSVRSEERRVGKECRASYVNFQIKKKKISI